MEQSLHFGPFFSQILAWANSPHLDSIRCGYVAAAYLMTAVLVFSVAFPQKTTFKRGRITADLFLWAGVGLIFLSRSLSFYAQMLNPDEAEILVAAINMQFNPQPWVSGDSGSVGPVAFGLPQLLAFVMKLLGGDGSISFFTGRLAAALLAVGGFVFMHKTASVHLDARLARAVSLIYVCFFSFTYNKDFKAYNSEFVFVFFHAACLYLVFDIRKNLRTWKIVLAGLLIGASPYIKLQAPPILAVTTLWIIYSIFFSMKERAADKVSTLKPVVIFLICTVLPTILIVAYCLSFDGLERAYQKYLVSAFTYHIPESDGLIPSYFMNVFEFMSEPRFAFLISISHFAFLLTLMLLVAQEMRKRKLGNAGPDRAKVSFNNCIVVDWLFSIVQILATLWAILRPGNVFSHYVLFLPTSAMALVIMSLKLTDFSLGTGRGSGLSNRRPQVSACLALIIVTATFINFKSPSTYIEYEFESASWKHLIGQDDSEYVYMAKMVLEKTKPDDSIYIWGWDMRAYVYANRRSASPMTNVLAFWGRGYSEKIRDYFFEDLKRNQPKLIIDIVTPGSFWFTNRPRHGLEAHPAIWPAIRDSYEMVEVITVNQKSNFLVYSRKE